METTLIIAEKPSVARDIAAALGGFKKGAAGLEKPGFLISNALGHLVQLSMPLAATSGGDLETLPVMGEFVTELIDDQGSKAQFRVLERLMKRADVTTVVNACDAGREGELIFRLIYEHAKCRKPTKRMWIQSMTEEGLREAFRKMRPGSDYDALAAAARARSEADFLVGINGSRALSKLRERQVGRRELMTQGRVQSPTLLLPVLRERDIRNFVPRDYWEVHATFGAQAGQYIGKWFDPREQRATTTEGEDGEEADQADQASSGKRFFDRNHAEAIVAKCKGVAPSSVTDTAKRTASAPPKLYHLTALQQDANRKFKFPAKKTLKIAQALYETHKVTTYPRTDSDALPEDYVEKVHELMGSLQGSAYGAHAKRVLDNSWVKPDKRIFNNKEISDHFAIIITGIAPQGLDEDERKIYDLIARRFVAAFHPAAEYDVTTRVTVVSEESFKSTGRVLVSKGWLEVYGVPDADVKKALCPVKQGEAVTNLGVKAEGFKTKPPARYTEATLLKAMETAGKEIKDDAQRAAMKGRGLGTPATRADIIEGLLSKGSPKKPKEPYLTREKDGYLLPTEKAMGLFKFLDDNGLRDMASAEMTGDWEHRLGLVADGKYDVSEFKLGIKSMVSAWMEKIRNQVGSMPVVETPKLSVACPSCGKPVAALQQLVECSARCGFKLWRNIGGKVLSDAQLTQILKEGVLADVELISFKTKRPYKANLRLNLEEGKVAIELPERERGSERAAVDISLLPVLDVPCPKCKGTVRIHDGDNPKFACEKGDWTFWRTIAKRVLSPSEGLQLLRHGEMPAVAGFVGSKGKFAAGLKLSRDKTKAEFVFEGR